MNHEFDIRPATPSDAEAIRQLHHLAFPENEADLIAELSTRLLSEPSNPATHSLMAVIEKQIVGHVAFSPVFSGDDETLVGYLLAPLAVHPDFQSRGVGTRLTDTGIELTKKQEADLVILVYGDPSYYSRFGFHNEQATLYRPPYPLEHPHGWQGKKTNTASSTVEPIEIQCHPALNDPSLW